MATTRAIRIKMDVSELEANVPSRLVRQVLQTLDIDTIVISNQANYTAGSRVYNADIRIGTDSTTDYGIAIDVDSAVSNARWAAILKRILQIVQPYTHVVATESFTTGSGSGNNTVLTVT